MLQIQDWDNPKGYKRILITDGAHQASIQIDTLVTWEAKVRYAGADALIYALWVNTPYRGQGRGRALLKRAERMAKEFGCKVVALTWDEKEAPRWVLDWYLRQGYNDKQFGRGCALLVKDIEKQDVHHEKVVIAPSDGSDDVL